MTAMMLSFAVSSVILWASRCQGNRTLVTGGRTSHRGDSFDVVDAVPVKTDEGGESHRARHGTDKRHGVAPRRKYVPPWPLVDVVIPCRYHPFAGAQNNAGPGITRARRGAVRGGINGVSRRTDGMQHAQRVSVR